jgi:outer membrane protein TolC
MSMAILFAVLPAAPAQSPPADAPPAAAAPASPPSTGAAAAALPGGEAAEEPAGAPLTLDEAVRRGYASNPALTDVNARIEGTEAARKAARGNFGPKLRIDANAILWNDDQTVAFGGGGTPAGVPPALQPLVEAFSKPVKVRDQVTNNVAVQLIQPITGLYGINQGYQAASTEHDVAVNDRVVARRQVALNVTEAYFRVLQAKAMHQAALAGVQSLEARLGTVQSLERNGMAGRNDVLRVQVALEGQRQQAIATANGVAQARAGLAVAMGADVPDFGPVAAEDPSWAGQSAPALTEARDTALLERPELKTVQERISQAETGVRAAKSRLVPDLNVIGEYQHTGGSKFQDEDAFFVGGFLTWIPWEWGATWYQVDQAETNVTRARAGQDQVRNQINYQVQTAWYAHSSASEALNVAQVAVTQAEEAARLERARYEAQRATTTDLLDAENALTQARLRLEAARYDRIIALARLRDAMGEPLTGDKP